ESRITVARREKDRVQAQADWAKIRAPFDAVIVARTVDPGSFVQNATTAQTKPMLILMRLDLVTIAMMVPERGAAFVKVGTDAAIDIELLPGRPIQNLQGKITRF